MGEGETLGLWVSLAHLSVHDPFALHGIVALARQQLLLDLH